MSATGLQAALDKMQAAQVNQAAQEVFRHYYQQVESGVLGVILEDSIAPLENPTRIDQVEVTPEAGQEALDRTVIIKLNGGLGTSMGLEKAKMLLQVRDGKSFFDITVQQILWARQFYGVRLPILFMNSFRTDADTQEQLAKYPELKLPNLPLTFLQNMIPKLLEKDLTPAVWEPDPSLEWCPPGHGDLYTALFGTGLLDQLIEQGFYYASISNGDNLGACPDPQLAGWFAASGAPFAAEICPRSSNDRKGGHVAVRKLDGRIILRDTAMVAEGEMDLFTDIEKHAYFNTNNLWFDLRAMRDKLAAHNGVLGLPLIRNVKHVDPTDNTSPKVIQIETGMGTSLEVFDGAQVIQVPRTRFLPVKTTNELLLLRSDLYTLGDDGLLTCQTADTPRVILSDSFRKIDDFETRIPQAPSLKQATYLQVDGDWTFGPSVEIVGKVHLPQTGGHVDGRISETA